MIETVNPLKIENIEIMYKNSVPISRGIIFISIKLMSLRKIIVAVFLRLYPVINRLCGQNDPQHLAFAYYWVLNSAVFENMNILYVY